MLEWLKIQLIQLGLHNIPRRLSQGGESALSYYSHNEPARVSRVLMRPIGRTYAPFMGAE